MKLRITDDRFDNTGTVYDFDSVEELIDEMMPAIKTWALDDYNADSQNLAPEERLTLEEHESNKIEEVRKHIEIIN